MVVGSWRFRDLEPKGYNWGVSLEPKGSFAKKRKI